MPKQTNRVGGKSPSVVNPKTGRRTRLVGLAGAITLLGSLVVAVVGNYEGLRLYAYKDVIGVWTACYGETKGIKPGMKFTKDQCDVMFIESLQGYEHDMRKCLKDPDGLPDKVYVAFLSLTYNIGAGGFCKGSVPKAANAGNLVQACNNLLKYNKAGGRVIKGLVTRRKSENKLCLEGVRDKIVTVVEQSIQPTDLKRGDKGPWVEILQAELNKHGAQLAVDGKFGPATAKAVEAFQIAQGLEVTGVADTAEVWPTLASLADDTCEWCLWYDQGEED